MDGALFLFMAVGGFGGILIGMGVGWFFGRREGAKTPQKRLDAAAPAPREAVQGAPPPPSLGLLLRRVEEGLEVTLDGVAYRHYATMPADSRQRLLAYLGLVRDWMQGKSTREVVTAARVRAQASEMLEEEAAEEEISPQAMVRQIDEIVQTLRGKANMAQPVRIVSGLTGGVNILVGTARYESIDDVPDEAVRALVRRAVKIWESRR